MSKKPRKLPEWMKGRGKAVGSALNNIVGGQKPKTYKKRENLFNDLENAERRVKSKPKRDEYQDHEDEEPLDRFAELPMIKYEGKITYLRQFYEVAEIFDELLKTVEQSQEESVPVSFDLEWTFNYQTGPEPISVLQVCMDLSQCYIVQMSELKKIPASLSHFLYHTKTVLHGVNIKNDMRKLARDFPCFNGDKLVEKCCDLGDFYNSVFSSKEKWSLDRLTAQTIRHRVDKSRHIRMSQWNRAPLNKTQLLYASIDVYTGQKIYHFIKTKQNEEKSSFAGYFSAYGEEVGCSSPKGNLNDAVSQLMNFQ